MSWLSSFLLPPWELRVKITAHGIKKYSNWPSQLLLPPWNLHGNKCQETNKILRLVVGKVAMACSLKTCLSCWTSHGLLPTGSLSKQRTALGFKSASFRSLLPNARWWRWCRWAAVLHTEPDYEAFLEKISRLLCLSTCYSFFIKSFRFHLY